MRLNIVIIIANIIMMFLIVIKIDTNNKAIKETKEAIKQIKSKLMNIDDYHTINKLNLSEIEKDILTGIIKNNNDIKEIKNKITTGKKNKRISQLVDENNKLKEENNVLKKRNLALRRTNEELKSLNNTYSNSYAISRPASLWSISKPASNDEYHW